MGAGSLLRPAAVFRDAALGEGRDVSVTGGAVRVFRRGAGKSALLLHGAFANANLWRKVVPLLSARFQCTVPDLPMAAHTIPMGEGADLSLPGLGRMALDVMDESRIRSAVVVGNDTGGAVAQWLAVNHPDRVSALVLTPCDAFDNFFPPLFRYLQWASRVPGACWWLSQNMRVPVLRRGPIAFGWLTRAPVERKIEDTYALPWAESGAIRRDAVRLLRAVDASHTRDVAARLGSFPRRAIIAWPPDDRVFAFRYAERLARALPNASLERLADCGTLVPEDQPARLAQLILSLV